MKPASRSACVQFRGSPSSTRVCCSGMISLLHLEDVQVAFEDSHGEVVGDHPPLGGVVLDLAPELAVAGGPAEHVAHRDMDEAGKLAQDGSLSPLATAGHSE